MKISKKTIDFMENFAKINNSMSFKSDTKEMRVMSPMSNIIASVNIEEEFPVDFAIYDMQSFVNLLKLKGENVDVDFNEKTCDIGNSDVKNKSISYRYTPNNLVKYVDKMPNDDKITQDVTFKISNEDLAETLKAARIMQLENIIVRSIDNRLEVVATTFSNSSSHESVHVIDDDFDGVEFNLVYNIENLLMMPAEYNFIISKSLISKIYNDVSIYYVALESVSTYGE